MLDVVIRPRAELDIESIQIFLAYERRRPQAAVDAIARIYEALELVKEFPDMGGRVHMDELSDEYRTIPANPYTIYYRYDAKTITVCRVLHQRQDMDTYTLVDFD